MGSEGYISTKYGTENLLASVFVWQSSSIPPQSIKTKKDIVTSLTRCFPPIALMVPAVPA